MFDGRYSLESCALALAIGNFLWLASARVRFALSMSSCVVHGMLGENIEAPREMEAVRLYRGCVAKPGESHFLAKNAIRYVCSLLFLFLSLSLFFLSLFIFFVPFSFGTLSYFSLVKRLLSFHGKTLRHCSVADTEFDSGLTSSSGT